MVRRIGGEERSFRAGQAVGEGGTARAGEPLTAPEMAAIDAGLASYDAWAQRWLAGEEQTGPGGVPFVIFTKTEAEMIVATQALLVRLMQALFAQARGEGQGDGNG